MNPLSRLAGAAAFTLVLIGSASAGPVSDFETAMRGAYADYRGALFQTNANQPEAAVQAVDAFKQKWAALASANTIAPPQYADDPAYAVTLAKVASITDKAAGEVAAGKLTEAHATLEAIRFEVGGLHERNGIVGFSDRMNAYHAKMEDVLAKDYSGFDAAGLGALREDAAVLAFLAADIKAHPPTEAADPAYGKLLDGMTDSVTALANAAHTGDAAAAKTALGNLKVPYSKLFLKFG
jgi:hypothetical protein